MHSNRSNKIFIVIGTYYWYFISIKVMRIFKLYRFEKDKIIIIKYNNNFNALPTIYKFILRK